MCPTTAAVANAGVEMEIINDAWENAERMVGPGGRRIRTYLPFFCRRPEVSWKAPRPHLTLGFASFADVSDDWR